MTNIRKYAILCSTLFLCGLLFMFLHNLKPQFQKVEKEYEKHHALNLSAKTSPAELSELLFDNDYVANKKDADFIADTIVSRLKRMEFPNLYHLQKRAYGQVPMLVADSSEVLTNKVSNSKKRIGLSGCLPSTDELKTVFTASGSGVGSISVIVESEKEELCYDVPVRLISYYFDSTNVVKNDTLFAKTDAHGMAQFNSLDTSRGYSVLPIKIGFEYGMTKGIHKGKFKKGKYTYKFTQQEHRVQMIDNATLRQIKNDGTITVRTPAEYKATVIKWFVFVLIGWWLLCFVLVRRKRNFDPVMIATAMFLTGFCVLIMFAIQNPLTEELRGVEMAKGVLMGLTAVILMQYVDFVKFYQNRYKLEFDVVLAAFNWLFLPFKRKVAWLAPILSDHYAWWKKIGALLMLLFCLPFGLLNVFQIHKLSGRVERFCKKMPKGFGWLLLALVLTALLWTPFGQSIGGMKVNLKIGPLVFQPSEIAKYLILFFMAAFFTQNADTIIDYSRPAKTKMMNKIWNKVKTLGWVIGGLVVLMLMYAALGDMGPALVIGVTFVLLYSLVKSKVNLENLSDDDKWDRIFTCDFAMLIYGVISFAAFIVVGAIIGNALVFALLWFVAWIAFGLLRRKQFFETAFIINMLVFAFVFGGQVMQAIPGLAGTDTAERFEQRTKMCVNTWGELDIEHAGANAEAVSNTQVANGLWAIATGGMTGQGLGKGNPNLIPAFHTDMILSSIGEETGWIGLLIVVLVLALLLRRMIVVGYKVGHPFAFYFCTGVAIVTGVQFFIIALGSSGMIPLTGITVPFLSYGKVSMILNLMAFGIVLSFSQNVKEVQTDRIEESIRQRSVGDYNYPVSIVSWTFVILALFTLYVWQYYAVWKRGDTLIHPAFVYNNQGTPLIEYNPRIVLLTKEMWAGNIYDRNGVLLATSDRDLFSEKGEVYGKLVDSCGLDKSDMEKLAKAHTKRYYPFAEHLFFMLGDINNGLYFSYDENNPIGYMAEAQHLAYLRDYDNVMRDENGNAVKVRLTGTTKGRFIDGSKPDIINYVVRDNKELIKYLESGQNGRPLRKHNERVKNGKFDLHLTLDAKLQKDMQDKLKGYVCNEKNRLTDKNLLRISVVVLDAKKGDLLTSANYPIPSYKRLREEDSLGHVSYYDHYKDKKWFAYTERDLGLTYQTMPGSTAKVMSAMAGLNKLGVDKVRTDAIFPVYRYEVIDISKKTGQSKEPPMGSFSKAMVPMKEAIVKSSNCYFINLVNHFDCYTELEKIYAAVGISIGQWPNNEKAYTLHYEPSDVLKRIVSQVQMKAVPFYEKYIQKRDANELSDLGINVSKGKTMRRDEWMWAWGQGTMDASPLNMARVVSIVANEGKMPITRYLLRTADKKKKEIKPEYVSVSSKDNANELKTYMQAQAAEHGFSSYIGGKTGTPERVWIDKDKKVYDKKSKSYKMVPNTSNKPNDGWYIFYVETGNVEFPILAVALRMERINDSTSGAAMNLAKEVVLQSLIDCGYLNNIR